MTRLVVGPFNRVEGDLEVQLEYSHGYVSGARVVSTLYRGFEKILGGKDPRDALVITPRICGICSISQSYAAARALAGLHQGNPARNGELVANIILAAENIADHLTHFYMFFMPDFTRSIYHDEPWFTAAHRRFAALRGEAAEEVLQARASFLHLVGMLAGKWPHTLAIQPGGSTRAIVAHEHIRLLAIVTRFRRFLQNRVFGCELEALADLTSSKALEDWLANIDPARADFAHFAHISRALKLNELGRSYDNFMSYGAYQFEKEHLYRPGLMIDGQMQELDTRKITEDVSHSWMQPSEPLHPFKGRTETALPDDEQQGYSWCKAPRMDDRPIEVGALARQLVNGHGLFAERVASQGSNVENRVFARLLEMADLVLAIERWLRDIRVEDPFMAHSKMADEGRAFGAAEAARGALGHWIVVSRGKIENYQIVAPTTWNFSPRDHMGKAGPLEKALEGAPVRTGEKDPVAVQHIVRSYDPCMVCTVH